MFRHFRNAGSDLAKVGQGNIPTLMELHDGRSKGGSPAVSKFMVGMMREGTMGTQAMREQKDVRKTHGKQ